MKKTLLLVLFLSFQTTLCDAQVNRPGRFGLGLIFGLPTGISAKYWLDNTHAFDAALGFGDISVHADYLWHIWDLFPQPQQGRLGAYWGLVAKVGDQWHNTKFGIRALGGIAYYFPRHPVEVFFEVVPVLDLSPGSRLRTYAGAGARYYFR